MTSAHSFRIRRPWDREQVRKLVSRVRRFKGCATRSWGTSAPRNWRMTHRGSPENCQEVAHRGIVTEPEDALHCGLI
jgi:hypothetical protein